MSAYKSASWVALKWLKRKRVERKKESMWPTMLVWLTQAAWTKTYSEQVVDMIAR